MCPILCIRLLSIRNHIFFDENNYYLSDISVLDLNTCTAQPIISEMYFITIFNNY